MIVINIIIMHSVNFVMLNNLSITQKLVVNIIFKWFSLGTWASVSDPEEAFLPCLTLRRHWGKLVVLLAIGLSAGLEPLLWPHRLNCRRWPGSRKFGCPCLICCLSNLTPDNQQRIVGYVGQQQQKNNVRSNFIFTVKFQKWKQANK